MPDPPAPATRDRAGLLAEVERRLRPLVDSIDVRELSAHNIGYAAYGPDKWRWLVESEKARYVRALDLIERGLRSGSVCDVGAFVPYLPVALGLLGYRVRMVDRYDLYSPRFQEAIGKVAAEARVEVCNLDILRDDLSPLGGHDVVLLMAVVEHLNGSPKELMQRVRALLGPSGLLLFEVPNIAELSKRVCALRGGSPLGDYAAYFHSAYPYTGHNREMTVAEVRYLLEQSGFRIESLECYDYYRPRPSTWREGLLALLKRVLPSDSLGQVIGATARLSQASPQRPHATHACERHSE